MGVKSLWTILAPIAEKKPLWELKDQTVAIDLSGWICENQTVDCFNANLHLRNLFFRVSYLLLVGVKPIFILEGKAPTLKHDTIERRIIHTNSSSTTIPLEYCKKKSGNRTRLNCIQKQCEELLKYMGVPCYYSEGEAETLCALLNKENIVNAVISQDSDCFLYGAQVVYRNFTIGSCGGSVEMYTLSSMEKKLSLGRNKLIALSLLCGCDYNDNGILGIGKETAMKFLSTCTDSEILPRLCSWRRDFSRISEINANVTLLRSKLEINLMRKALRNPSFPFLEVQKEFLNNQLDTNASVTYAYEWKQPNVKNFAMFTDRYLGWNTNYSLEKCVPLLSRWHLVGDNSSGSDSIQLERIVKKRNLRNVPSYEVKWKDFDVTTIEPASILAIKYKNVVHSYEYVKKQSCKGKKIKKNVDEQEEKLTLVPQEVNMNNVIDDLDHLNIHPTTDDSLTVSDFECSARDLLELSSIVESIASGCAVFERS